MSDGRAQGGISDRRYVFDLLSMIDNFSSNLALESLSFFVHYVCNLSPSNAKYPLAVNGAQWDTLSRKE